MKKLLYLVLLMPLYSGGMEGNPRQKWSRLFPWAIAKGKAKLCRWLIAKGADVNARYKHNGCNRHLHWSPSAQELNDYPLLLAWLAAHENRFESQSKAQNHVAIIRMLLEHGADPNATASTGNALLHLAATHLFTGYEHLSLQVYELLLTHKAHVNLKGEDHRTPLFFVTHDEYEPHCALLLKHGADVTAKTSAGDRPLHYAARHKAPNICKMLLDHGADLSLTNMMGQTPLHAIALLPREEFWTQANCPLKTCDTLLYHPRYPYQEVLTILMIHRFRKNSLLALVPRDVIKHHIIANLIAQCKKEHTAFMLHVLAMKDINGDHACQRRHTFYNAEAANCFKQFVRNATLWADSSKSISD